MIKVTAEPEEFAEYKKIIKELLFYGANRAVTTESGLTARDILDERGGDLE